MSTHEFGIMDNVEYNTRHDNYEPEKYKCISVDDSFIEKICIEKREDLKKMKTFFHTTAYPGRGLDYYGITLIPPESLEIFRKIIIESNNHYTSQELESLINIISKAKEINKFLIHFGI